MTDVTGKLILVDKSSNGVATITLNRPEALNALTRDMLVTLAITFRRLSEDVNVKVIILTGAGRAFSAGIVRISSFFVIPLLLMTTLSVLRSENSESLKTQSSLTI